VRDNAGCPDWVWAVTNPVRDDAGWLDPVRARRGTKVSPLTTSSPMTSPHDESPHELSAVTLALDCGQLKGAVTLGGLPPEGLRPRSV
jgi:hypothetical protein